MDEKMDTNTTLDGVARELAECREELGCCPSQQDGTQIDGKTVSNYCMLGAVKCDYRKENKTFIINGNNVRVYALCTYDGTKLSDVVEPEND